MSIYVREFKPQDAMEIKGGVLEPTIESHPKRAEWAQDHSSLGPAYTGIKDGKIIGCGGIMMLWEGVGEGWANFSPEIQQCPKSLFYCMKKGLDILWDAYDIVRVQAMTRADFPQANRLLEHLGFVQESRLRKFWWDQTDAFMYAKVRD